jgi:sterol 3beta-glucosyltransferase
MHVLILTYGSRGDVQPYVALGRGLLERGHVVTLATSVRFRDLVEAAGLRFGPLSDDMLAILDTDQGRELVEDTTNLYQVVKRTLSMMRQVGPLQRELVMDCWAVAREADPDLVLFHPKAYAGPDIAEKLGVPVALALAIPMMVPSSERPNMGFPELGIGGWYNRGTYRLVNGLLGLSGGKHSKALRAELALPRQKLDILHAGDGRPIPVLFGISPHVVAPAGDWGDHIRTTGYWFLDREGDWTPPPELMAFLEAGPPPVYVGFGSMAGRDPARLGRAAIEGLRAAGVRGILATGWGGLAAEELPDTVLRIDQAPHDWLFPRVAAVVHHGGAGSTAAGLRAGRPTVVVPFFGDQPFWGRRVHELGVGPAPIPQKKLTPDRLAAALRAVTADPGMAVRAEELGRRIRAEDGVAEAVALLEAMRPAVTR